MLLAAGDFRHDAVFCQPLVKLLLDILDRLLMLRLNFVDVRDQLLVNVRLKVAQRLIFQLAFNQPQPQPVR